ncbi:MAG: hypothetical protein ABI895_29795 [Deltaproteobacteria bacterium]
MVRGLRRAALCLVLTWAVPVLAGPRDVRLLPTELGPPRDGAGPAARVDLAPSARRLDAALRDALLDFGLTPLEPLPDLPARDEEALVELAQGGWVVSPELSLEGSELRLRLRVVAQASAIVLARAQRLDSAQLEVRSLGMLRELLEQSAALPREPASPVAEAPVLAPPRRHSTGRAVLALHTAAFGGYLGYSLQRASGSDDARLTYPLAALGAGIGLGSAVIVADEWDIHLARAWFLGAALLWTPIGISLATDRQGPDRHLLGVVGAVGGLTLATAGLVLGDVDDGGAAFTHSGALLGLVLGGLGEMAVAGNAQAKPMRGIGYGILAGVTVAGALATQLRTPTPTELLSIDLSALLGGLGGAALGTPLLVSQERSTRRDRVWLSGVMLGTVVGAGVGYWITCDEAGAARAASGAATGLLPSLRLELGNPVTPLGLGVSGQW